MATLVARLKFSVLHFCIFFPTTPLTNTILWSSLCFRWTADSQIDLFVILRLAGNYRERADSQFVQTEWHNQELRIWINFAAVARVFLGLQSQLHLFHGRECACSWVSHKPDHLLVGRAGHNWCMTDKQKNLEYPINVHRKQGSYASHLNINIILRLDYPISR